jgi:hypothetical protein
VLKKVEIVWPKQLDFKRLLTYKRNYTDRYVWRYALPLDKEDRQLFLNDTNLTYYKLLCTILAYICIEIDRCIRRKNL